MTSKEITIKIIGFDKLPKFLNDVRISKENGSISDASHEKYLKSAEHIHFLNDCKRRDKQVLQDLTDCFSGNVNGITRQNK
jgi:hypothetical protein